MKEYEVIIEKIQNLTDKLLHDKTGVITGETGILQHLEKLNGQSGKNTRFRHIIIGASASASTLIGGGVIWKIIN